MSNNSKKSKKYAKKLHPITLLFIVIALIGGALLGYAVIYPALTENDKFELIGNKTFEINVGDDFSYKDDGLYAIEFGKDISSDVKISTNMTKSDSGTYSPDTSAPGSYYIIYTLPSSMKYKNIQRVRTFSVNAVSSEED